jgi:hypothetical protein
MGIDRIGKGGAPPPSPDASGVDKTTKPGAVDKPFSVERSGHPAQVEATRGVEATSPLARLRAGEIDVEGYLDSKVDEATKALHGLPAEDLADIKSVLRDQLASDPGLVDLVRSATGQVPKPPQDE